MNLSAPEVLDANARTNQLLRRLGVIVAVLFLLLNTITAFGVFLTVVEARNQARLNGQIGAVILAVTGCTATDTPEQCRDRTRVASISEGARRISEVDCADRRREAGLPAPTPPDSCVSQTPESVYPGTTTTVPPG